jgi:hypothetical protein
MTLCGPQTTPGEAFKDYVVELHPLAATCEHGTFLEEELKTQFRYNMLSSYVEED